MAAVTFTKEEREIVLDALKAKLQSVKRMQSSKPSYKEIFDREILSVQSAETKVRQS